MAYRFFQPISVDYGGQKRRGYRLDCGECGAGESIPFAPLKRNYGDDDGKTHTMIRRKFEGRGWVVGESPRQDRCPRCAAPKPITNANLDKPKLALALQENFKVTTTATQPATPAPAPQPRDMGIDDALLISTKLHEVYIDASKGYGEGWTDAKVASALNVPRAWVRDIREKQYGKGAAGNDDIDAAVAEARSLLSDCKVARDAAEQTIALVTKKIDALTATLTGLRERAGKIERAVHTVEQALR